MDDKEWEVKEDSKLEDSYSQRNNASLPPAVAKFFEQAKQKHWLVGGKRIDWEPVEVLAKKWGELANENFSDTIPTTIKRLSTSAGLVTKYKANQITLTIQGNFYKKEFPDLSAYNIVSESDSEIASKNLATRVIQLTVLGLSQNINKGKKNIVDVEYEILDKGGWLIGFTKKEILVYFPLSSEIIMKKLKRKVTK